MILRQQKLLKKQNVGSQTAKSKAELLFHSVKPVFFFTLLPGIFLLLGLKQRGCLANLKDLTLPEAEKGF